MPHTGKVDLKADLKVDLKLFDDVGLSPLQDRRGEAAPTAPAAPVRNPRDTEDPTSQRKDAMAIMACHGQI